MNRRKFMGIVGAAAAVPALAGKAETAEPKLFALVHDGTFDGDSLFYFPSHPVPYKAGMPLEEIKEGHFKVVADTMRKYGSTEKEIAIDMIDYREDHIEDIKGAIIVPESAVKAMDAVWKADPCNDSATYGCNRAAKHVGWELKLFTIGKGMY